MFNYRVCMKCNNCSKDKMLENLFGKDISDKIKEYDICDKCKSLKRIEKESKTLYLLDKNEYDVRDYTDITDSEEEEIYMDFIYVFNRSFLVDIPVVMINIIEKSKNPYKKHILSYLRKINGHNIYPLVRIRELFVKSKDKEEIKILLNQYGLKNKYHSYYRKELSLNIIHRELLKEMYRELYDKLHFNYRIYMTSYTIIKYFDEVFE